MAYVVLSDFRRRLGQSRLTSSGAVAEDHYRELAGASRLVNETLKPDDGSDRSTMCGYRDHNGVLSGARPRRDDEEEQREYEWLHGALHRRCRLTECA